MAALSAEVIALIHEMYADGLAKKEIARELIIEPSTVRYHLKPETLAKRKEAAKRYETSNRGRRYRERQLAEARAKRLFERWKSGKRPMVPEEQIDRDLYEKARNVVATKPGLSIAWAYKKYAAGLCEYTGVPFVFEKFHSRSPEVDRIVPGSQGGEYTEDNCRMVCRAVNLLKYDRPQEEVDEFFDAILGVNNLTP